jgi:hypothetical protein
MRYFIVVGLLFFMMGNAGPAGSAGEADQGGREKRAFYLETAEDLQILCGLEEGDELYEKGVAFCYGFISGVMSFYGAIAEAPGVPRIVCSDTIISRTAMVENFLDWSARHPEYMADKPVDSLVRSAVQKWPCPETK